MQRAEKKAKNLTTKTLSYTKAVLTTIVPFHKLTKVRRVFHKLISLQLSILRTHGCNNIDLETGRRTSSSGRPDISPPAAGNVSQTVPASTITTSATKTTETISRKPTSFCEFAPSKNIHYDVCKDSPWMGCVARNDGKMHIGCLDVPGYEYDCLRGMEYFQQQ